MQVNATVELRPMQGAAVRDGNKGMAGTGTLAID